MLLAAACELRYAAPDTTFYIPELDMGVPFSLGGVSLVVCYIGLTRAADMILNGTKMDAVTALAAGLVTEVVADGEPAARVDTIARRVAARPAALLLASLVSLGEAARDLVPADTIDLATMQFAADDPEAAAVGEAYARRFRHQSLSRSDASTRQDGLAAALPTAPASQSARPSAHRPLPGGAFGQLQQRGGDKQRISRASRLKSGPGPRSTSQQQRDRRGQPSGPTGAS